MNQTNRRELLCTGGLLAAAASGNAALKALGAGPPVHTNEAGRWDHEYTFGHTMLFMEEYHRGTMEILGSLNAELGLIGELTSRAARVIRKGGTVWTSMNVGHMPHYEQKETRRGSPGIMRDHDANAFSKLQKGDMVFTNHCNREVLAARERGVYVVCVTVNYVDNEFRPEGFTDTTHSNPDGLKLRDVSNVILHSHVPYQQGLVHAPEIPEFAICPSSQTGLGAIHWMLNAELANKLADPNARPVDQSALYLSVLTDRVEQIRTHLDRIRETAVAMAHRIRQGGRWYARSIEHPGFESEFNVASGVAMINRGDWNTTPEKNVMLITAISPDYAPEIHLAREKQIEGAYVIGIGPGSINGQKTPVRLIDIADAGFDNFSPESGGVIQVSGRDESICPTSGVVGNVIQQMITAQWCDEMVRRGSVPHFLMGHFQEGGTEYNTVMKMFLDRQGF